MAKRDGLWIDADPATTLPAYSGLELRGALNSFQAGVIGANDFKVTAGAGLTVDSAAGRAAVQATAGGVTFGGLYYVVDDASENSITFERTGGGTGIPANASTNPRLDAVVLHQYDHSLDASGRRTWIREYVPGTAVGGAALGGTLPSLPTSSLLIAEVLVPANNPATIPSANIRDRRPWAKGARFRTRTTVSGQTTTTAPGVLANAGTSPRLELTGAPAIVKFVGIVRQQNANGEAGVSLVMDGATLVSQGATNATAQPNAPMAVEFPIDAPTPGSHVFQLYVYSVAGSGWGQVMNGTFSIEEELRVSGAFNG